MLIGIDGNMWYCSNGLSLADSSAHFTFERTLREAFNKYVDEFKSCDSMPKDMIEYLDFTPEEYKAKRI